MVMGKDGDGDVSITKIDRWLFSIFVRVCFV